jgi:hypothetical protein
LKSKWPGNESAPATLDLFPQGSPRIRQIADDTIYGAQFLEQHLV